MHVPKVAYTAALVALATVGLSCAVPVAAQLDDNDSAELVAALGKTGILATKVVESGQSRRFRVTVPEADVARAISVMRDNDLPPPHCPSVADVAAKDSFVPNPSMDRARLTAAVGADLEKTLAAIDGVAAARVHIAIPAIGPVWGGQPPKPTASVLLRVKPGVNANIDTATRKLVAGAVAGMLADDVSVVVVPQALTGAVAPGAVEHCGQGNVERKNLAWFRVGVQITLVLLLVVAAVALWRFWQLRPPPGSAAPFGDDR